MVRPLSTIVIALTAGTCVQRLVTTYTGDKLPRPTDIVFETPHLTASSYVNPIEFISNSSSSHLVDFLSNVTAIGPHEIFHSETMTAESRVQTISFTQQDWNQFVETPGVTANATNFHAGSFYTKGCGFSATVEIKSAIREDRSQREVKAFFKAAYSAKMSSSRSESHLREIKAAYLDEILGLNVVPRTIGFRIEYDAFEASIAVVKSSTDKSLLESNLWCMPQRSEWNRTVPGSLMIFYDGVESVPRGQLLIQHKRRRNDATKRSALRYATLLYLAGCVKSEHNHFMWNKKIFLAIDNDRCFMPRRTVEQLESETPAVYDRRVRMFEHFVFSSCAFPDSFIAGLARMTGKNQSRPALSQQLRSALANDALASDLLEIQPETFDELDERVTKLWSHIQTCQAQLRKKTKHSSKS